jgi:glutaredoxin
MNYLVLYHFKNCPFCIKVCRFLNENNMNIELKDIKEDLDSKQKLINQGGSSQVPCLHVTFSNGSDNWIYESNEIIKYLTFIYSLKSKKIA